MHGNLSQALSLFTTSINSFHHAGNPADLAGTFAHLAVFHDTIDRPEIAATLYGITTHHPAASIDPGLVAAVKHVRNILNTDTFDRCVATGADMETAEAVRYVHAQIELIRSELAVPS